jgi:predicted protein tyrosine phosphatase
VDIAQGAVILPNLLFICSKNKWRSPTAELLFRNHPRHHARSAGTSDKARIRINQKLIDWADVIFFMERKHKVIVIERFQLSDQKLIILNIEDNYPFNDPELIDILKAVLSEYF